MLILPYVTLNSTCYSTDKYITLLYNYFFLLFNTISSIFSVFCLKTQILHQIICWQHQKCFSNQLKVIDITWFLVFIVTSVIFSGSLNSFVRGVWGFRVCHAAVHFGMPNLANFYKVTDKFVQKYQNIVWLDWQSVMSTTKYMGIFFIPSSFEKFKAYLVYPNLCLTAVS